MLTHRTPLYFHTKDNANKSHRRPQTPTQKVGKHNKKLAKPEGWCYTIIRVSQ